MTGSVYNGFERIDDERVKVSPTGRHSGRCRKGSLPSSGVDSFFSCCRPAGWRAKHSPEHDRTLPWYWVAQTPLRKGDPERFPFHARPDDKATWNHARHQRKAVVEDCSRIVSCYIAYIQQMADLPAEVDVEKRARKKSRKRNSWSEPEDALLNDRWMRTLSASRE